MHYLMGYGGNLAMAVDMLEKRLAELEADNANVLLLDVPVIYCDNGGLVHVLQKVALQKTANQQYYYSTGLLYATAGQQPKMPTVQDLIDKTIT